VFIVSHSKSITFKEFCQRLKLIKAINSKSTEDAMTNITGLKKMMVVIHGILKLIFVQAGIYKNL